MVDMATADIRGWTFKVEKNPHNAKNVSGGSPITQNMIKSFDSAKEAMRNLLPVLPNNLRKKIKSTNGVSHGFIP